MKEFIKAFSGLKRNFGYCDISKGYKDESGKIRFDNKDYGWTKRPVTDQDYIIHLEGKGSMGIQPCDDEDNAVFGAIDIDPKNYSEFKPEKYLKIIEEKELPLIPIRSKSGGLHLYVFAREKVKAADIREFLDNMLFILGLPAKTEIFPKQTTLKSQDGNKSNGHFINLPYFNKDQRVALYTNGREMDFDTFMKCVSLNARSKEELKNIGTDSIEKVLKNEDDEFKDGPPCLGIICSELKEGIYVDVDNPGVKHSKLPDGRDEFVYNLMTWAKKKYSDKWEKVVEDKAAELILYDQSWDSKKVQEKIKLWKKDTAGFKCHGKPVNTNCHKNVCRSRKYGIGKGALQAWPEIVSITKWEYKPDPAYDMHVKMPNGKIKIIHAKHVDYLVDQKRIKSLLAAHANYLPPTLKNNKFTEMINSHLLTAQIEFPEIETQPIGILFKEIQEWINGPQARSFRSFEEGSVYIDEKTDLAYFTWSHFYKELSRSSWNMKSDKTLEYVKEKFKAKYKQKRYPKAEGQEKPNPNLWVIEIEVNQFAKEKPPQEILEYDGEDIA
tara:strand:- start:2874 stop:4532 length:1659 start_codon:yes stop_codon:yes gene_type:complete